MMFRSSIALVLIHISASCLQVSHVEASFLSRFIPTSIITLDIPHNNKEPTTVNIYNVTNSADNGSSNSSSSQSPQEDKCPNCACGIIHRKMRIVGGVVAEQQEFPWMVALSRKGKFYCAASIITKQHLLTAAHCVEGMSARDIRASLGEYNRGVKNDSNKVLVKIKQIIRHPDFEIANFKNDIALLKIESPVSFRSPHIQPACLPRSENKNYTGVTATVTGWGRLGESKPTSNELRKVEVPIISNEDCRENTGYVSSRISDTMICAGYKSGRKDSCQGDSGGPLQIQGSRAGTMEIVGIVSWGRGCARPNFPGVYTRVDRYLQWIDDNIEEECACKT